jgi:serine/threonine-protein kinase
LKILDFGIAKVVSGIHGTPRTTRAFGTPTYMAPEQLAGDGLIDERADLYALAHVAYTLLVGEPYFGPEHKAAKNVFAFAQTLMSGAKEPASVRAARAGVTLSSAFDSWFARATHTDPARRFATAPGEILALADALSLARPTTLTSIEIARAPTEAVRISSTGAATESSAVASASYARRPRGTRWMGIGIGVAAVMLGAYIWSLRKPVLPLPAPASSGPVPSVAAAPPPPSPAPTPSASIAPPALSAKTPLPLPSARRVAPKGSPAKPASKPYDPLDDL